MVALYSANIALHWVLHTSQLAFRYALLASAPLPLITKHLSSTQHMNFCNHEVHPLHCSCLYTASSCLMCVLHSFDNWTGEMCSKLMPSGREALQQKQVRSLEKAQHVIMCLHTLLAQGTACCSCVFILYLHKVCVLRLHAMPARGTHDVRARGGGLTGFIKASPDRRTTQLQIACNKVKVQRHSQLLQLRHLAQSPYSIAAMNSCKP